MQFSTAMYPYVWKVAVKGWGGGAKNSTICFIPVTVAREDGVCANAKLLSPHPRLISLRIRITGPLPQWSLDSGTSQCNSGSRAADQMDHRTQSVGAKLDTK
jgi:hypothetical protein